MGLELWAPVATIALLIVTIGTYVWKKMEKFDDRLRNMEIEVGKLDERTKPAVAPAAVYAGEGTLRITWQRGEEGEE